jgi:sterol desaturase/sphingolipid hydroxylase (fatty acid hydroxylase superfamily)
MLLITAFQMIYYWILVFILSKFYEYTPNKEIPGNFEILSNVVLNQSVFTYPVLYNVFHLTYRTNNNNMLFCFAWYYFSQCVYFYFLHRLFHLPFFWKNYHRVHHKIREPLPHAAFYCHWLEHVGINIASVLIGPLTLPHSYYVSITWGLITITNAIWAHAGQLDHCLQNEHEIHHKHYTCNYGTGKWMDKIFGTFKSSTA